MFNRRKSFFVLFQFSIEYFQDRAEPDQQLENSVQEPFSINYRQMLLLWAQQQCQGYPGIIIEDFTNSWRNGRAFLAILHRHKLVLIIEGFQIFFSVETKMFPRFQSDFY